MPTPIRQFQNDRPRRRWWLPRLRTINWALLVVGLPVVGLLRLQLSFERWIQVAFIAVPAAVLVVCTLACVWAYRRRRRKTLAAIALVYAAILLAAGALAINTVRRVRAIDAIVQSGGYVNYSSGISIGPWQFSAPKWLSKLGGRAYGGDVTDVMLQGPGATDVIIDRLHLLPKVQTISLQNTTVTAAGLAELRQLDDLRSLSIGSVDFTDDDLAELARFKNLLDLGISSPLLGDDDLARLSTLPELRTLNIGPSDHITDQGLVQLQKLPKIQKLFLIGVHVGDKGLTSLSRIPTLTKLYLMGCRFSDPEFVQLPKRKGGPPVINLVGTNVTQQGADRLKQAWPNAQVNFLPGMPMQGGPSLPAELNERNAK